MAHFPRIWWWRVPGWRSTIAAQTAHLSSSIAGCFHGSQPDFGNSIKDSNLYLLLNRSPDHQLLLLNWSSDQQIRSPLRRNNLVAARANRNYTIRRTSEKMSNFLMKIKSSQHHRRTKIWPHSKQNHRLLWLYIYYLIVSLTNRASTFALKV